MTFTFPDEACAVTLTWESTIIAQAIIHKQKLNERHLLWHYSHNRYFCWIS